MDALMLTIHNTENSLKKGHHATLLGRDIVSAFNMEPLLRQLREQGTPNHITQQFPYTQEMRHSLGRTGQGAHQHGRRHATGEPTITGLVAH